MILLTSTGDYQLKSRKFPVLLIKPLEKDKFSNIYSEKAICCDKCGGFIKVIN